MHGKYLSVDGDYVKSGLFAVWKSSPYARKVFNRIWRMRGKDLCANGEDEERLLVFGEYAKVWISPKIIIQIKKFFRFFLTIPYGMT